ncbi:Crossover junction endonuclease EME1B [Acorus calamus]|uniref:Crossover junction endonuclease EME1B n=1 Tax=Acorus calamus TaxID=4465 RepID=A0AAV9CW73_ACOCL|nr:Crossover junction endonuclease EME1B [Acorus calamus]
MDRPPVIPVEILSDDDEDDVTTPLPKPLSKKPRRINDDACDEQPRMPIVFVVDDDPTPQKPTPSFVPETPLSPISFPSIVRCTYADASSGRRLPPEKISDISGVILLESDNESEDVLQRGRLENSNINTADLKNLEHPESCSSPGAASVFDKVLEDDLGHLSNQSAEGTSEFVQVLVDSPMHSNCLADVITQELSDRDEEIGVLHQIDNTMKQKRNCVSGIGNAVKNDRQKAERIRKNQSKEEKMRLNDERKQKKQQERLQKEALKAEAAQMKKLLKEKQKWEKGKFALKSIVAEIDARVVENGSVGGYLLSRFAEKGISFRITSNPFERSILWKMIVPDDISQISCKGTEILYVLFVYEAEEFCNLVANESLMDHVCRVQRQYPSFTICYLTNRLMAYINKREQGQYKNPSNIRNWIRPPIEEVLSKLSTHFTRVHSRNCIDEPEISEHIVGLTCSLANCQFRKKPTQLSVNANGALIPKGFFDKSLIKNSVWLKTLIAIPKVQPRFAIAIGKKYPTMRSLLNVYMNPNISVHEKEFLLKDLPIEGLLGNEDRRLGAVCSKRVYRIFMAQSGGIKTDDVEDGADFF